MDDGTPFTDFLRQFWLAAGGAPGDLRHVAVDGSGALASAFAVTDFAAAAIGAAGLAVAELIALRCGRFPAVAVDRRLASFWFGPTLQPQGWTLPPLWDAVAGDYPAADGWIRLHTNAPHHRRAALAVLGCAAEKDAVARAVAGWHADALEAAIVEHHGCAAAMRSVTQWAAHPHGRLVWNEPLLHRADAADAADAGSLRRPWPVVQGRPLQGVRVLDLTRILAGPAATRFLAGFGADVLRIDPYGWEEPGTVPEVVLGKRCARLDLGSGDGRAAFERLLAGADVLVHGYRPGALAALGLGEDRRRALNPGLIDVSLDAYGWSGPWAGRRGFDSLIQMSTGIAEAGMRAAGSDRPVPLPVQAIDHATGYLMAAAAVRALGARLTGNDKRAGSAGCTVRASLARSARLLVEHRPEAPAARPLAAQTPDDLAPQIEHTAWGPARRVKPPVTVATAPMQWDYPAGPLGSARAEWR